MDTDNARSLREWRHGDNAPKPAPALEVPEPMAADLPPLWWRVSYAPVGNQLTVALMEGADARAKVLALENMKPWFYVAHKIEAADQAMEDLKERMLIRYREAQRLIAVHSGPCAPTSPA